MDQVKDFSKSLFLIYTVTGRMGWNFRGWFSGLAFSFVCETQLRIYRGWIGKRKKPAYLSDHIPLRRRGSSSSEEWKCSTDSYVFFTVNKLKKYINWMFLHCHNEICCVRWISHRPKLHAVLGTAVSALPLTLDERTNALILWNTLHSIWLELG